MLGALPLAACNIQISSSPNEEGDFGVGNTRLPAPSGLTSISLDGAVQLSWSGSVVANNLDAFRHYRIHSTGYDASSNRCNDGAWVIEGTTVSDGFVVSNLRNGITRCFAVSTVAKDGGEGARSVARADTPRFGGRFVLVDAFDVRPSSSGWVFHDVAANRVGLVTNGTRSDLDFRVERHGDGSIWFRPVRASGRVAVYGNTPIPDLTSLDRAPSSGYAFVQVEALPGYAYVFLSVQADGVHYGAVRVAYVGRDYVVLDWAYQSAPGNVELIRLAPVIVRH